MNAIVSQLPQITSPNDPNPIATYQQNLANQITLLAGQINAANHKLLKLIAEFDLSKGWSGGGTVRTCAHWLNWKCGIGLGAAREKLRVAHALAALPLIDTAFAAGEISYSKVRAMTRVATAENEEYLLMIACHGTASHMEQLVGKYQRVQRSMEDDVEQTQQDARTLEYYQDEEGMWVIHAKLPPDTGALVIKTLQAMVAPLQAQRQQAQLDAKAAQAAQLTQDAPPAIDGTQQFHDLLEHTRADALVAITEAFLANGGLDGDQPGLKGSERCQIILHVDIDTLRQQQHDQPSGQPHCHLEEGQWLSQKTARRLACDASLVTVLEDEQGNVLNIGRRARTVPPAISRALAIRDKTCRFPGCCESRYVDAHHITHWADGGETSLENLVTLCRFHHRQLHKGSFSIRVDADQPIGDASRVVFSTEAGGDIELACFPQFPDVSAEIFEVALQQLAPEVDEHTCTPNWTGEQCDYGMAVDGLLQRDLQGFPH